MSGPKRCVAMLMFGLLAAALPGCGNLMVSVDVLDPQYVKAEIADDSLRKAHREIIHAQPGDLRAKLDKNFKAYQAAVIDLANSYERHAASLPDPDSTRSLTQAAQSHKIAISSGSIPAEVTKQGGLIEGLAQGIREASAAAKWSGLGPIPTAPRSMLADFLSQQKKIVVAQESDVLELQRDVAKIKAAAAATAKANGAASSVVTAAATTPKEVETKQQTALGAARRSIIEGAELSNTEYAYVVAQADPGLWKSYNVATGSGTFGDVDVVIRMNSTADFSVKGMRFDASTVAQVASKVLTQSVVLGAQMAGVPVSNTSVGAGTGSKDGGEALASASANLNTLEQTLATREALIDARKTAARVLARSLLGVVPQMKSAGLASKGKDDPDRAALHQSIRSTLDALKPQLSLQTLQ